MEHAKTRGTDASADDATVPLCNGFQRLHENSGPSSSAQAPRHALGRRWWLVGSAFVLLCVTQWALGHLGDEGRWGGTLGLGLVLTAWLGWRAAYLVAASVVLMGLTLPPSGGPILLWASAALLGGQVALSWWCYHQLAGGTRQLHDPHSATAFLLLVPGACCGAGAWLHALVVAGLGLPLANVPALALSLWLNHALGVVTVAPPLLVVATPWLVRLGLTDPERADIRPDGDRGLYWSLGEIVEVAGLAFGAAVLALILAVLHARHESTNWLLWCVLLLVIVWTSLRQELRGGTLAASSAAGVALGLAAVLGGAESQLAPLRGNLLAQCCTALLIGASAGWIRASEARYRLIVGHIPVVLYSARLLRPGRAHTPSEIEITLVSSASRQVFGRVPETLLGRYDVWLERVHPEDRELVRAAMAQLCLQKQPVSCEYRILNDERRSHDVDSTLSAEREAQSASAFSASRAALGVPPERWLRDTLAPHYDRDGKLDGWEGVIEDITDQRTLAHDLRRATNMLHAIVSDLPAGVYFVHGPMGQPLLVNARARQLLGQREDLAAGLQHLPDVYRLHRPDGSKYPAEELPVTRALREGMTGMKDDIVVHRADGRRIPLVSWAAPVDLTGQGQPDGAVWVLEDLSVLRQAENARGAH